MHADVECVHVERIGSSGDQLLKNVGYGQSESLIVLLVGTLIKSYRGRKTISCGEAAKIYINPEIPEKIEYCERLGLQLPPVTWMAAADDQYSIAFKKSEPEEVNIAYLLSTDPNDYLGKNMVSTVTLLRLASEVWWFLSCMACHKKAYAAENEFVCSDSKCNCIAAAPRYKLRVIGADTTGEVEFIFFANAAEQVIGKKIDALTRAASRRPNTVPAEITTLISQKFTLNHSVNEKGLHYGELSFQVNCVTAVHQKANVFEFNQLSSGSNKSILNEVSTSSQSSVPTLKDIAEEHSTGVDTENNKLHQPEIGENSNPIQTEEISVHSPSATADKSPPLTMTPETHMSLTKQSPETINDTGTKAKRNSAKRTSTDGKKSTAQKKLNMGAPEENAT